MAGTSKKNSKPFTMVRRSIWKSRRFKYLPDDAARYLYLYFLTCGFQTSTGCFAFNEAYALADLDMRGADWTQEKLRKSKAVLVESELICADDATGEILIARWWQDNSPSNESWHNGARRQCEAIESPDLRDAALNALEACRMASFADKGLPVPYHGTRPTNAGARRDERLIALGNKLDVRP